MQCSATALLVVPMCTRTRQDATRLCSGAEPLPCLPACLQGECGNKLVAILYYVTFTLAVPMIMIQLFAAVVIENFEKQQEMEEWSLSPALLEVGLTCCQPGSGRHARLDRAEARRPQSLQHTHLSQPLCSAVQLLQVMHTMTALCSLCSSESALQSLGPAQEAHSKPAVQLLPCIPAT